MSFVLEPKQRTALALPMVLVESVRTFNFCQLSQAILTRKPGAIWISILMGELVIHDMIYQMDLYHLSSEINSVISEAC